MSKPKFVNIAHVGVPRKDDTKRYLRLDKKVKKLTVEMEDGTVLNLKGGDYVNLNKPYKSEKTTDEEYAALTAWKRFDATVVINDG